MKITRDLILKGRSKTGGWSKAQLEELEITWPPKSGWIDEAIGREVSKEQAEIFLNLKDAHLEGE